MSSTLSKSQVGQFRSEGYIDGLPVFSKDEMDALQEGLAATLSLLDPGESTKEIREWHEENQFLFKLCMNETILSYVEPLIGPDFYMWASNFFIKEPRTLESVTWHQDAYYWPLDPISSCTVWLAFDDVDKENGGMKVIPGSHKRGIVAHNRLDGKGSSVLGLEADVSGCDLNLTKTVCMPAGHISVHRDTLIHGSPGNPSDRRRAGLTIRYSPTNVKCDLSVNPHFRTYLARGKDEFNHNPVGAEPTTLYGRLRRNHQSVEEAGYEAEAKTWKS